MVGVIVAVNPSPEFFASLDKATQEWTEKAARGEVPWICASCCCGFNEGMPDQCAHGDQTCTDIIKRDKAQANKS